MKWKAVIVSVSSCRRSSAKRWHNLRSTQSRAGSKPIFKFASLRLLTPSKIRRRLSAISSGTSRECKSINTSPFAAHGPLRMEFTMNEDLSSFVPCYSRRRNSSKPAGIGRRISTATDLRE